MSTRLGQIVEFHTQGDPQEEPVTFAAIVTKTYRTPSDAVDLTVFHPGGITSWVTQAREGLEHGEWSAVDEETA